MFLFYFIEVSMWEGTLYSRRKYFLLLQKTISQYWKTGRQSLFLLAEILRTARAAIFYWLLIFKKKAKFSAPFCTRPDCGQLLFFLPTYLCAIVRSRNKGRTNWKIREEKSKQIGEQSRKIGTTFVPSLSFLLEIYHTCRSMT